MGSEGFVYGCYMKLFIYYGNVFIGVYVYIYVVVAFMSMWIDAKERVRRLKLCLIALQVLTLVFSAGEKILTYFCITQFGGSEANLIPRLLMQHLGLIPAIIIGFIGSVIPLIGMNLVIRKFKWNSEGHYWVWIVLMTVYLVSYIKTFEHNLGFFGG